jgi:4-hydroxy-tetrahydrodipicolinate synthase
MLYNVPGRTITSLTAATVARIVEACPNVVAIKEASADLALVGEIIRLTPPSFDVYSGDDATLLPLLSVGGCGIVSVIAHVVGQDMAEVCRAWFAGEQVRAAEVFVKTLPVTRAIFSVPSPAPTKYALNALGHNVGSVRLPLVDCTEAESKAILGVLKEYGLAI